jgi:hypothetical protein
MNVRWAGLVAICLAAAGLAAAYGAQYGLHLVPCPLCLWERWPYRVTLGLGLLALLAGGRGGRLLLAAQAIDAPHHQEDDEREDHEVEPHVHEVAPGDHGHAGLLHRFERVRHPVGDAGERYEVVGELEAAREAAHHRHHDVVHERIDDLAEGAPDDHPDGEVDHVAADREFPEFRSEAHDFPPAKVAI